MLAGLLHSSFCLLHFCKKVQGISGYFRLMGLSKKIRGGSAKAIRGKLRQNEAGNKEQGWN
jgi:hypothetical protein